MGGLFSKWMPIFKGCMDLYFECPAGTEQIASPRETRALDSKVRPETGRRPAIQQVENLRYVSRRQGTRELKPVTGAHFLHLLERLGPVLAQQLR
jgi:hypothetical protein